MAIQNTLYIDQNSIQQGHAQKSLNLVKKDYTYSHFRVGQKVEDKKWMKEYLLEETYCNDNCEIGEWIWMKINGLLKGQQIGKSIDLETLQKEFKVYNINNYITEQAQWDKVEW